MDNGHTFSRVGWASDHKEKQPNIIESKLKNIDAETAAWVMRLRSPETKKFVSAL